MNISDAARLSGLSAKQIRDYEKLGLLSAPTRNEAGYRQYNTQTVQHLRFIRHARAVGFSLPQIATLLQLQRSPHAPRQEIKNLTAQHIAALQAQILTLQHMVDELQHWHDACSGDNSEPCPILNGLQN
ncbi:MAG: MerR family DNA-binding protein [Cardiobacteriaceae bacterium]|nr:MerR family DNA-binding protein [Cardiobacteriaceae bacterium]